MVVVHRANMRPATSQRRGIPVCVKTPSRSRYKTASVVFGNGLGLLRKLGVGIVGNDHLKRLHILQTHAFQTAGETLGAVPGNQGNAQPKLRGKGRRTPFLQPELLAKPELPNHQMNRHQGIRDPAEREEKERPAPRTRVGPGHEMSGGAQQFHRPSGDCLPNNLHGRGVYGRALSGAQAVQHHPPNHEHPVPKLAPRDPAWRMVHAKSRQKPGAQAMLLDSPRKLHILAAGRSRSSKKRPPV